MNNIQVNRLMNYQSHDAAQQLDDALILFYRTAWHKLTHGIKRILQLRCHMCGKRHFTKHYNKTWDGKPRSAGEGGISCSYGLWWSVINLPRHVWVGLTMGYD